MINPAIIKMITAMIGTDQIAEMVDGLTAQLVEHKNTFALLDGEDEIVIILFEDEKKIAYTIAALNADNKIVRQIETDFIKNLFLKLLKQKNA